MKDHKFAAGDRVVIHSLGQSSIDQEQEYNATVCGISVDYGDNPATIYIVHTDAVLDQDYKYPCCTIPQSCLRRNE
jgi:hypothetical protein